MARLTLSKNSNSASLTILLYRLFTLLSTDGDNNNASVTILNSTQLSKHVRTQVLTPQCPHLFNTTTYETTRLLLHVCVFVIFFLYL